MGQKRATLVSRVTTVRIRITSMNLNAPLVRIQATQVKIALTQELGFFRNIMDKEWPLNVWQVIIAQMHPILNPDLALLELIKAASEKHNVLIVQPDGINRCPVSCIVWDVQSTTTAQIVKTSQLLAHQGREILDINLHLQIVKIAISRQVVPHLIMDKMIVELVLSLA